MTAREMFEYALIELNKVEAPSLLLEDYNYFINKAVQQYINKVYNTYDLDQQRSDDLRVLKATCILIPTKASETSTSNLFNPDYTVVLPDGYFHVLNCIAEYTLMKQFKCYDKDSVVQFGAKRLTSDMFSGIINNYYMRPIYKRPYFYINNVESRSSSGEITSTRVNLDIRYGKDDKVFKLTKVYVDYLKTPDVIRLTLDQYEEVEDQSQVLQFPDYVCQEIINELVKLLMENSMDPRLQSNIPVNQTIAPPAQAQPQQGGNKR